MFCVAIDDEPIALKIITEYCNRYGGIELVTFTDPLRGVEFVRDREVDLLFLDIEMGGVNGVELARDMVQSMALVFTTAYAQFAIDGFDLDAVDFLHKPFSYTRFVKAVDRVRQRMQMGVVAQDEEITLKVEYRNVKLPLLSIKYIESMDNYIKVHIVGGRPILSQMSLKSIEELLPARRFARVHRSFIVSRQRVTSYSKTSVVLSDGVSEIPIGRKYIEYFEDWIKQ
ncbi:MAG: LytTR family DNA-binding domain-containing protein [Rikenellaceae bacterium]